MNWQRRNPYFLFRGSGDAPEPAGRLADRNVWPVTYLMLQSVEGGAQLFFYIVATLYAAELIWRERELMQDCHSARIHLHGAKTLVLCRTPGRTMTRQR